LEFSKTVTSAQVGSPEFSAIKFPGYPI